MQSPPADRANVEKYEGLLQRGPSAFWGDYLLSNPYAICYASCIGMLSAQLGAARIPSYVDERRESATSRGEKRNPKLATGTYDRMPSHPAIRFFPFL